MDQSKLSLSILSDITTHMKYAKYLEEHKRRETWSEICERNMNMHIKKYPQLESAIRSVYENFVLPKKVLASMRSKQFAGTPIERNPSRIYNCAYLPIDHPFAFSEALFLLLGGCFEPTTLVKTKTGEKMIKDVTIEDEVLTYDIEKDDFYWVKPRVAGETMSAKKQKIKLTLENNKEITCTADHKFYTTNRGWVEAQDLTEEDDIKTYGS